MLSSLNSAAGEIMHGHARSFYQALGHLSGKTRYEVGSDKVIECLPGVLAGLFFQVIQVGLECIRILGRQDEDRLELVVPECGQRCLLIIESAHLGFGFCRLQVLVQQARLIYIPDWQRARLRLLHENHEPDQRRDP